MIFMSNGMTIKEEDEENQSVQGSGQKVANRDDK
jgi:hypothetical protein